MSRQLTLFSKPSSKTKTDYEKFVNKKWYETGRTFPSKQKFLTKGLLEEWKRIRENGHELKMYMEKTIAPIGNRKMMSFFKVPPKRYSSSSIKSTTV